MVPLEDHRSQVRETKGRAGNYGRNSAGDGSSVAGRKTPQNKRTRCLCHGALGPIEGGRVLLCVTQRSCHREYVGQGGGSLGLITQRSQVQILPPLQL